METETELGARRILAGLTLTCASRGACSVRHIVRPALVSQCLAAHLGLPPEVQARISMAAAAHDIGKLMVPDTLLAKTGKLSATEWATIQSHAAAGARLLPESPSTLLRLAAHVAHAHHEHFNGKGYPDHLCAQGIPLAARIVAIADVFDALTDPRPYHQTRSDEEAAQYICSGAGTQFDPDIAGVFERHFGSILITCHAADMLLARDNPRQVIARCFSLPERAPHLLRRPRFAR
ncbi:HD-GYP domain-containing protein [Silvimonas iriomotensis]|uniref:HD-GYP domain-containing protein n=1 Tax=Silvimonas iriomotensis TaxID=449662 RepID=A0ABQ2P5W3_9NEIS|nr:HD domain-containing phosphohydrolase [Silvimonas iriomotensis]GGP18813.1 hypothetical protein GCM10010970_07480 [Silvimonas iriomotensis]